MKRYQIQKRDLLGSGHLRDPLLLCDVTENFCGITGNNCVRRNILSDYTACANDGVFADHHICQDRGPRTYRGPLFYDSSLNGPILFGLQFTVRGDRTWIAVVDECDAMTDENAILNIDTFTDKRVTGDFAILSNSGVFLNFDEGANLCVIADFTAVEVDKF